MPSGSEVQGADDDEVQAFCMTSDGFFDLEELPKKVAVVGAGYIAVELAGRC